MKEKVKKLNFFKKLSLVQQSIVVLSFVGLLLFAIMMPLVDYNLRSIIDDQMYDKLSNEQDMIINNSFIPVMKSKHAFHIIYDSSSSSVVSTNISSDKFVEQLYHYVFGDKLNKFIYTQKKNYVYDKSELLDETYYYMISRISQSQYLISVQNSDYSNELIDSLKNQTINIQYGFFIVIALVMIIWVVTDRKSVV